jgi:hypothetical protein
MSSRKNIGIAVAVLGLLLTCCLCPLALNNLYLLATRQSIYGQMFSTRMGNWTLATYVSSGQLVCAGLLALIVLVIGVVVFVQAKGNGKTEQPASGVPGGYIPTS